MGNKVSFDYSKAAGFVSAHEVEYMKEAAERARAALAAKNGVGNDFLGWINLPVDYDREEFAAIKKAAEKIQSDSEVLVVIGIGGSYLGARAAIEFLRHGFYKQYLSERADRCDRGPGFFRQRDLQVRNHHGTGDRFSCIQGNAGEEIRQERSCRQNLCHHGQGPGSFKESGRSGRL